MTHCDAMPSDKWGTGHSYLDRHDAIRHNILLNIFNTCVFMYILYYTYVFVICHGDEGWRLHTCVHMYVICMYVGRYVRLTYVSMYDR